MNATTVTHAKKKSIIILTIFILISIGSIISGLVIEKNNKPKVMYYEMYSYKTKRDDTIEKICSKFDIYEEELKKINNLNDNSLKNKTLKIPNVTIYNAEKNEDLKDISNKFRIPLVILKKINNIETTTISKNQEIIIPNTKIHIVEEGDTIEKLSQKYGAIYQEIVVANSLKNDSIKDLEFLIIPYKIGNEDNFLMSQNTSNNELYIFNELLKVATEIYDNGKYKQLPVEEDGYKASIKDMKKLGYNIEEFIVGCSEDDRILLFDIKHKDYYPKIPVNIRSKCYKNNY